MAITYIPVVGQFTYRASPASPAASAARITTTSAGASVRAAELFKPQTSATHK